MKKINTLLPLALAVFALSFQGVIAEETDKAPEKQCTCENCPKCDECGGCLCADCECDGCPKCSCEGGVKKCEKCESCTCKKCGECECSKEKSTCAKCKSECKCAGKSA